MHALIDRLAVLLRQVGAADPDVDDGNAERVGLPTELVAHASHQLRALVAHHLNERALAEHAPHRRNQQGREPRIGALDRAHRLEELQRVIDAIAREGIDHEPLLVGGDDLLRLRLEVENALIDVDHAVDQRELHVEPGLGDDTHRLAEPDDQRLLGLMHGEQAAIAQERQKDRDDDQDTAGKTEPHREPPVVPVAGPGAPCRRGNSLSGRYGTTPDPPGSRMILSAPPNTRSMVSR